MISDLALWTGNACNPIPPLSCSVSVSPKGDVLVSCYKPTPIVALTSCGIPSELPHVPHQNSDTVEQTDKYAICGLGTDSFLQWNIPWSREGEKMLLVMRF